MSWLQFAEGPPKARTRTWTVLTQEGGQLGRVQWFARWRCYGFFPLAETVYEKDCLREIAEFCESMTKAQREQFHHTKVGGMQ